MQPSSHFVADPLQQTSNSFTPSRRSDDLLYQAVTVAAILMLLGSLWAF